MNVGKHKYHARCHPVVLIVCPNFQLAYPFQKTRFFGGMLVVTSLPSSSDSLD